MNTYESALGNIIKIQSSSIELIESIKQNHKVSYLTAKIIANKNIPLDEIEAFLNPQLKNNWIDTNLLPNIDLASNKIIESIKHKQKIGIIGDYDVDGVCSSIMLKEFYNNFGLDPIIWIPTRQDGYGPSDVGLNFFNNNPVDLLILVDCGTNSHDFIKKYNKSVIVIDHHHSLNPIQDCLINPNATSENCSQEMKDLCATSLTFFVVSHILKKLSHEKYQNIMQSILDLTALAIVCDMMPMNNLNRSLVKSGIKIIEKQERIGLRQLINFSNLKFPITSKDIGFSIGPRINACGRIESPAIALNLLKSKSFEESNSLIHKIELINNYRKELQNTSFNEAIEIAKMKKEKILCLYSEEWNIGVIGIIAAMIQNEENKPTIVGNIKNGIVKCSARSNLINIGALIERAVELGILETGGGHKNAAGLTCKIEKWNEFEFWINDISNHTCTNVIYVDAISTLNDIQDDYKKLAPFGIGNDEPKVLVENLRISKFIDKESYYLLILEESYKKYYFFVNKSQKKLINILNKIEIMHLNFSAIFKLYEKGNPSIEDLILLKNIV